MTDRERAGHGARVPHASRPDDAADPPPGPAEYPDAAAFRGLYRAHHGFVWRILARLGVPQEWLDDAAQEVFVTSYRRRLDYDPAVPVRSWLYGIARRVASDVRRGRARNERKLRALPRPPAPDDPSDALFRREAAAVVLAFLAELDEDTRMVFVLLELEGMSAPEAAVALTVKLNTVYSRLRRGRAAFARMLDERATIEVKP